MGKPVDRAKDAYAGYRYLKECGIAPLFPFGHGLSYTSFSYLSLKLSANVWREGDLLTVATEVENTGDRAGKEVVQLYLTLPTRKDIKPKRQLKGFVKVHLESGEKTRAYFTLSEKDLSFYDPKQGWRTETGIYLVEVGSSSEDIRLKREVQVFSSSMLLPTDPQTATPKQRTDKSEAGRITSDSTFGQLKGAGASVYRYAIRKAERLFGGGRKALDKLPLRLLGNIDKQLLVRVIRMANGKNGRK